MKNISPCIVLSNVVKNQDLNTFSAEIGMNLPIFTLQKCSLAVEDNLNNIIQLAELPYSHIIMLNTLEINQKISNLPETIKELLAICNGQNIVLLQRDFSQASLKVKIRRVFSKFCLKIQTGKSVCDVHSALCIYPTSLFKFIKSQEYGLAFQLEILARGIWADYNIVEKKGHILQIYKSTLQEKFQLFTVAITLILRALVPLPYPRHNAIKQEPISLRRPIASLRQLMEDPYNRATPWQLARTAAISISILTLPAPIIQSVALLFAIGLFRLNRLCAIAMIPFTWPPFLPGLAIEIGYKVRHGQWLTEFSIQTLGYEVGQRLWEWVIGSLILTPIFGIVAGTVVGSMAYMVAKKS